MFGRVIEQQVIKLMPKFYEKVGIDFTNVEGQSSARVGIPWFASPPKKKAPTP